MNESENKMVVEIWSDIMCPFCYLGKHKFEEALSRFPERETVKVFWKSFQLNPELKTDDSISIYDYLSEIKGIPVSQAKRFNDQLAESGKDHGIELNFDKVIVANTFRAHNLLHFAKEQGRQNEAEEVLFRAFFTEGRNVDDLSTLKEIGSELGFNKELLSEALEKNVYFENVRTDNYEAHQLGIRGVPFFVFDNKYGVSGAQDTSVFSQVIEKSFTEWKQNQASSKNVTISGDSCSVDGNCL